ncbi:MAG: YqhA family protein [Anaerolineae bacterium]|nr:YqhA family protein [Anaerolineae bacterium]
MLRLFFQVRYVAVVAVLASLAGALLLFIIGGIHTVEAFLYALGFSEGTQSGTETAVVQIIESLDNFLLGFVLLYFAYSTYFLFVAKDHSAEKRARVDMPEWLKVEDLGKMKRVLLVVILVLLAVSFLRLIIVEDQALEWTVLIIPTTFTAIAVSLRLVNFD